ncbi:MAG: BamA/TamA family outer membrane protein, partial [Thermoanaerobaculia bacterium]
RIFSQEFDFTVLTGVDFRQSFAGGSISYGRSFRNFQSMSLIFNFSDTEDVRTLFVGDGEPPITQELSFKTASVRPFWTRNTLDSRFEPSRGSRMSASIEVAAEALGSDINFYRPLVTYTWFKPVTRRTIKSSVGFNVEAGYIAAFGDSLADDGLGGRDAAGLFPQQRFFLGGDNSVRGVNRRSIVVREEDGAIRRDGFGFPVGGTSMFLLNLEYHVQLTGPFRIVFFGDAGGVFDDDQSIDPDLLRYSAGAELRIRVPLFPAPLRFIYAINLEEKIDDQFKSLDFSLSTTF